jgi:hypothetical protein
MRAAALRRWLYRSDQDDAIKFISSLLAKSFPPGRGTQHENTLFNPRPDAQTDDMTTDGEEVTKLITPTYIQDLVLHAVERGAHSSASVSFRKRIRVKGVMFSTSDTHKGNSLVNYYVQGVHPSEETCTGTIEHIAFQEESVYFVVRPFTSLPPEAKNPFSKYKDFPAKLYADATSKMEVVDVSRVKSHVASFVIPGTWHIVVVSLSRY